jgi:hypothetical protein
MPKELLWFTPLVASELPDLACREDSYNAVPVVRLKLLGTVNDNESVWTSARVNRPQRSSDVEQVG